MRLSRLAFLFLVVVGCGSAEQPPEFGRAPQFGVAVKTGNSICLSILGARIEPKTVVALINPLNPQTTASVVIVAPSKLACPGIVVNQGAYKSYRSRIVHGAMEENVVLIAAVAAGLRVEILHGKAQAYLSGVRRAAATFRSCTSKEGAHLTVWEGKPLEGKRVWHEYYYLGYDLEGNCTEKDWTK